MSEASPTRKNGTIEISQGHLIGGGGLTIGAISMLFSFIGDLNDSYFSRREGEANTKRIETLEKNNELFQTKIESISKDMQSKLDQMQASWVLRAENLQREITSEVERSQDLVLKRLDKVTDRVISKINKQDESLEERVLRLEQELSKSQR